MKAKPWVFVPLCVFLVLIAVLWRGLQQDPRLLKSALIGKEAPSFDLLTLQGEHFNNADLQQRVSIVHVWATWCLTCQAEHPLLVDLARSSAVPFYGLAYKDDASRIKAWLDRMGDPYKKVGLDLAGSVAIDWGVYGTPETYLVDAQGQIRLKHVGPINHDIWQQQFLPLIKQLQG